MINPFQQDLSHPVNARDHAFGNPDADVRIVVYTDFANPSMIPLHATLRDLIKDSGDDVVVVYRHFPDTLKNPQGYASAQALEASAKQGKFEEMAEQLLANQDKLTDGFLRQYARAVGLDNAQFSDDFSSPDVIKRIKEDIASAKASHVESSPAIFVNGVRQSTLSERFIKELIAGEGGISG